jgi:hypothetical protein
MTQSNFSLANQSGASFRASNNTALQALATKSSGAAEPTTTYANQWWYDSANTQLKQRDPSNTSWKIVMDFADSAWGLRHKGTALGTAAVVNTGTASGQVPLLQTGGVLAIERLPVSELAFMPRSYLAGLGLSNNGTDASHDIDIAVGAARDSTDDADMELASALTKRIDASWAVGTGSGGLDGSESVAGTPDADTWYHVHLIKRDDTGVVDVLFSESPTAPTLPANYDYFRRIGAVLTDGSANILGFTQVGDLFYWNSARLDHSGSAVSGANVLLTLSVPLGVRCSALFHVSAAGESIKLYTPGQTVGTTATLFTVAVNGRAAPQPFLTNTSSQIAAREDGGSSGTVTIETSAYLDRRGRDD